LDFEDDVRWDVVSVEPGMMKAEIVRGRLETEGIPVKLRYEAAGTIYGLTLNGLGEVEILVPSDALLRARDILSQSFYDDELPWNPEEETDKK
jgi:hypothetical protein